jgi:hypothetical protein
LWRFCGARHAGIDPPKTGRNCRKALSGMDFAVFEKSGTALGTALALLEFRGVNNEGIHKTHGVSEDAVRTVARAFSRNDDFGGPESPGSLETQHAGVQFDAFE